MSRRESQRSRQAFRLMSPWGGNPKCVDDNPAGYAGGYSPVTGVRYCLGGPRASLSPKDPVAGGP
jgi:hypothetical protein